MSARLAPSQSDRCAATRTATSTTFALSGFELLRDGDVLSRPIERLSRSTGQIEAIGSPVEVGLERLGVLRDQRVHDLIGFRLRLRVVGDLGLRREIGFAPQEAAQPFIGFDLIRIVLDRLLI